MGGLGDITNLRYVLPAMNRRSFTKLLASVAISSLAIGSSGCGGITKGNSEKSTAEKMMDPGNYLIDEASIRYGVSDEAPSVVVKEFLDEAAKSGELIPLNDLQYAREYVINNGRLVPIDIEADELYGGDSRNEASFKYAFDANESTIYEIQKILNGETDNAILEAANLDKASYDNLVMMKKLGLTIEDFAVTDAQLLMADGNEDSMYIVNTFSTTKDDNGNALNGYLRTKLRKHGDMWIADKLLDYEVYTPDGKLDCYFLGREGNAYAWVSKAGVPIISDAIRVKKEGLILDNEVIPPDRVTVDLFMEHIFGYDEAPGEPVKLRAGGGRVIVMTDKFYFPYDIPESDFEFYINDGEEYGPEITEVIASDSDRSMIVADKEKGIMRYQNIPNNSMIILEPIYPQRGPKTFAWSLKTREGFGIKIKDGFSVDEPYAFDADGVADWICADVPWRGIPLV